MSEEQSDSVNDLLDQLSELNKQNKEIIKHREEFRLDSDNINEFILNQSGKLIKQSVEMVEDVRRYIGNAAESEEIEGLAKLIQSTASAIEILNKHIIQDKKAQTSFKLKQMEQEREKEEESNRYKLSREEVLQRLIEDAKLIEAEVTDSSTEDVKG